MRAVGPHAHGVTRAVPFTRFARLPQRCDEDTPRPTDRVPCRTLCDRARAGARWNGHRLPRTRPQARPKRCRQGARPGARRRPRHRALPRRDPRHGQPPAPERAAPVRLGRGERPALLCDAICRGRVTAGQARSGRPPPRRRSHAHRERHRIGTGLRPPPRYRAPRREAGECAPLRRCADGRRLRHRKSPRDEQHPGWTRTRHTSLHESRAGDGRGRGRAHRRVRAGLHAVRDALQRGALYRPVRADGDRQAPHQPGAIDSSDAGRGAGECRRHDHARDGEGGSGTLHESIGLCSGARECAAGGADARLLTRR